MLPAVSKFGALNHKLQTQSNAPEDGRNYVELIEITNKSLLLHLFILPIFIPAGDMHENKDDLLQYMFVCNSDNNNNTFCSTLLTFLTVLIFYI
jgi:hypothetical protein